MKGASFSAKLTVSLMATYAATSLYFLNKNARAQTTYTLSAYSLGGMLTS
jgi:hypothetical protein